MSTPRDFLFFVSTPVGQDAQGKHEQQQEVQARAHAARTSHARRRSEAIKTQKWVEWEVKEPSPASPCPASHGSSSSRFIPPESSDVLLTPPDTPLSLQRWSRTRLDNGNDEPFNTLSVNNLPPYVFSLLYAASTHKWSKVMPATDSGGANIVAKSWMGAAMDSPVALHALVYAMLRTVMLFRQKPGLESIRALEHYARCLAYLKTEMKRIENGTRVPTDNVLIAIAALSAHGEPAPATTDLTSSEMPMSPLANTQNIHVYGAGSLQVEHMQALYLLVKQRGGLENLALPGLLEVLELVDLCYASRVQEKPQFDRGYDACLHELDSFERDVEAHGLFERLGTGFEEDGQLHGMADAVRLVRSLVVALDQYQRKGRPSACLPRLLQARNAVQHRLLCLPPADTLVASGPQSVETVLYEICRLGLLIFSNMVLFPLPAESGVAKRLVGLLRECLLNAVILGGDRDSWGPHSGLLIWVSLLGGMSSTSASERGWYVSCLAHVMAAGTTSAVPEDWHVLEEQTLLRYVWWKYMCSLSGQTVWVEACSKLRARSAVVVGQKRPEP